MISSTIKVVDTAPSYDSRLSLQTAAAAYLAIRQIPSSITVPDIPTFPPLPPRPSSFNPSDGPINQKGRLSNIIQSAVEYILLALVLGTIVFILFRKLLRLKRQHEATFAHSSTSGDYSSLSRRYLNYFSSRRPVELQPLHHTGQPYPPYPDPHLPGFPAAYMGHARRRTHATDIDPSGRRFGDPTAEIGHDGELGVKDVLPAYDKLGGPPKYHELEMPGGNQPLLNMDRPEVGLEDINNRNDSSSSRDVGIHAPVASSHTARQVG